jgi:integrase
MIAPIKVGNVTIPISKRGDGRFWLLFRDNGKPVRRPYRKLETAKAKARIIATKLANNKPLLDSFSVADREIYHHAETLVKPFGVSVVGALSHWAEVKRKEASSELVPALVEKLITSKEVHKLSPRYMRGLRFDLRAFAKKFPGPIAQVAAIEIENYLRDLGVGDRRRNNIRDEIVTLFLFAKQQCGALPEDKVTQAEKVKRIELDHDAPEIYTPAQLSVIIEHISPDWLDWICCQAFEGIRPEEAGKEHISRKTSKVRKLMWTDFFWDERQIRIVGAISKTGRDRYITINDTFLAWCGHHRGETGPVCIHHRPDRETGRLAGLLGFDWINDGLRHSYASYWQSLHKDMARLKEEMGNSEQVNRRYYYHPKPAALAKRWWEVLPQEHLSGKIIQAPLGLAFR